MAGQTLWDQLISDTGSAIADIREKLVEEPWYGRTLDVPQNRLDMSPPELRQGDLAPKQETSNTPLPPDYRADHGIKR